MKELAISEARRQLEQKLEIQYEFDRKNYREMSEDELNKKAILIQAKTIPMSSYFPWKKMGVMWKKDKFAELVKEHQRKNKLIKEPIVTIKNRLLNSFHPKKFALTTQ